jgi:UDP-N-acetylglucosamine 2-epimerase (non-hydrolysing)
MIRLLSVVGARPNFMKIAPIVAELKKAELRKAGLKKPELKKAKNLPAIEHCLVHSGQHYDELLSGNFFADLGLPQPDVNLQVGSGSHAVQTAEIMKRIEPVLLDFKPQMVLVVGDVNSTLAAALTAAKLGIGVAHIEAGLRSFDMTMPEEINRKLTDAVSSLLFVTEQSGVENLKREGVSPEKIFLVGNVMIDSLLQHRELASRSPLLDRLGMRRLGMPRVGTGKNGSSCRDYGVLTLHRPSNVDDPETLHGILRAVSALAADLPIFFPVHPRTGKKIESFGLQRYLASSTETSSNGTRSNGTSSNRTSSNRTSSNRRSPAERNRAGIVPLDPLGYLDFLSLNDRARIVLTDSGGIQEETTVLGVPCLTLRENTERPATVEHGSNHIVGVDSDRILAAARSILSNPARPSQRPPLWDGNAARRIVAILREHLQHNDSA